MTIYHLVPALYLIFTRWYVTQSLKKDGKSIRLDLCKIPENNSF